MTVSIWPIFKTFAQVARSGHEPSGAMNSWLSRCVTTKRRNVGFITLRGTLEHADGVILLNLIIPGRSIDGLLFS